MGQVRTLQFWARVRILNDYDSLYNLATTLKEFIRLSEKESKSARYVFPGKSLEKVKGFPHYDILQSVVSYIIASVDDRAAMLNEVKKFRTEVEEAKWEHVKTRRIS